MKPGLRLLLRQGKTDKEKLLSAIEKLPYDSSEIPADVIEQLVELVPQIAELLDLNNQLCIFRRYHVDLVPEIGELVDGELDDRFWSIQSKICYLFAHLGSRAQAAIPALLAHMDKYPRFELNAWCIGKIGGPGVVRSLIEWTYWGIHRGRHEHDRKCYDSVCGAIRCLGEPAIQELLEIASPTNADVYERNSALLNLVQNTACPAEVSIPLIVSELDRIAGASVHPMCRKFLRDCLVSLGFEYAETVVESIEPLLLANSAASEDYFQVLSKLGTAAIPTLKKAVNHASLEYPAISALAEIGGEGVNCIYEFIATSPRRISLVHAIKLTPLSRAISFFALRDAIERWRSDWKHWELMGKFAVRRLGEFSDHQVELMAYLQTLHDDPDPSLATLADETLTQMMDKMDH